MDQHDHMRNYLDALKGEATAHETIKRLRDVIDALKATIDRHNGATPDDGEMCQDCGRRFQTVWRCTDDIWKAVTGSEAGILCLDCFWKCARLVLGATEFIVTVQPDMAKGGV